MIAIIVSGGISFLIVLVTTNFGVSFFKSKKIGQSIKKKLIFMNIKRELQRWGVCL